MDAKAVDDGVSKLARPAEPANPASDEAGYLGRFVRRHGWRIAIWFFCLLLPLWGFAALVGEIHEHEAFAFDAPLLQGLHARASPSLDRFFVLVSRIGFAWGTVPFDVLFIAWLAYRRRFRDGLFFALAVVGSLLLDVAGKAYFHRDRPDLWLSITPEYTYSFPSGHAMGSATLGAALVFLGWNTRWRWPVAAAAVVFVFLVGLSRVYLGVHYPSDILAGWCAALAWVFGIFKLVDRGAPPPPVNAAPGEDTVGKA